MKYMPFNNSCSYAGIANLLEEFNIDIEDHELAIEMKVPFIFKYDDTKMRYFSGPMVQRAENFNYYLGRLGLRFVENEFTRENAILFLQNFKQKCMMALKISEEYRHAVIYCGNEGDEYTFLNNRRKNTSEPEYYRYKLNELKGKMNDRFFIGYIEKGISDIGLDIIAEINNSILYLSKYVQEVGRFTTKVQTLESLNEAMDLVFRALFLDVYSMMEIIGEVEITERIFKIRSDYLNAMKLKKSIKLSEYISLEEFNNIIVDYKKIIQLEIKKLI